MILDFETKVRNQSEDSSSESEKDVAHDNGLKEKLKPLDQIPSDPEIQIQMFFSNKSNPVKKKIHVSKSRSLLISLCTFFLHGSTAHHSEGSN